MKLSKNFTLEEMLRSETASRYNFKEQFSPPTNVIENLKDLCIHILQPLRDSIKKSIRVTSGYRCLQLNKQVGGSSTSDHMQGRAADIVGGAGVKNSTLFKKIVELKLPFDQLIWEFGTNKEPQWIHVSYSPRNRRQILIAKKVSGRTIYENYKI